MRPVKPVSSIILILTASSLCRISLPGSLIHWSSKVERYYNKPDFYPPSNLILNATVPLRSIFFVVKKLGLEPETVELKSGEVVGFFQPIANEDSNAGSLYIILKFCNFVDNF